MSVTVRLRPVEHADLDAFFAHQLDAEATRMAAVPPRDREAFDAHWTANVLANPTGISRTILAGGRVAGHIGSWVQDGSRVVGYWLGREFWGQGIATLALREFLLVVTERPLRASVARHNVGSMRVLEKCGFTAERVVADDDGVELVEVVLH